MKVFAGIAQRDLLICRMMTPTESTKYRTERKYRGTTSMLIPNGSRVS